jgi:hypothetical protein
VKSLCVPQEKHAEKIGKPVAGGAEALDRTLILVFLCPSGEIAWRAASCDAHLDLTLRVFSSKVAFGWSAFVTDHYAVCLQANTARFLHKDGMSVGEFESGGIVDAISLK